MSSSGRPANASVVSRAANSRTTGSASSLRATKPNTCAEARSNHCASSMTHSSGRSCAASEKRLKVARATRKRSGAAPALTPNVISSASRCGPGSRSTKSCSGAHN